MKKTLNIKRAREMATFWHQGQVRKYTGQPYIVHPARVAKLIADNGGTENQIIAAWLHDTLEDNGIDTILANPYKTKIIAQAKIKSDKLDARILSDLLRSGLISESYVPVKEFREKRSLVRHRE